MTNEKQTLRINIDGKWSAQEMSNSVQSINDLYALFYGIYTKTLPPRLIPLLPENSNYKFQENLSYSANSFQNNVNYLLEESFASLMNRTSYNSRFLENEAKIRSRILQILATYGATASTSMDFIPSLGGFMNTALFSSISERLVELLGFEVKSNESSSREAHLLVLQSLNNSTRSIVNDLLSSIYDASVDYNISSNVSVILDTLVSDPEYKLQVVALKYGSEGFKDFAGLGVVVGHIKDLLMLIINRDKRKLEVEEMALNNQAKKLENLKESLSIIKTAKELGYEEFQVNDIMTYISEKDNQFSSLVKSGKITSIDITNKELK